jgi:uncharacterized protein DUF5670
MGPGDWAAFFSPPRHLAIPSGKVASRPVRPPADLLRISSGIEADPEISQLTDFRTLFRLEEKNMLGLIAVVLIVLWLLGFLAFHVSSALIHVLLVVAIIMLVFHFLGGRSSTA